MTYKIFETLVNNRLVDHRKKCGLFSDSLYGFRSSLSTTDLLAAVFDRAARDFKGLGLPELYHLIYPRLLTEPGRLVFFTKSSLMGF